MEVCACFIRVLMVALLAGLTIANSSGERDFIGSDDRINANRKHEILEEVADKRINMGTMVDHGPHLTDSIYRHAAVATDNQHCSEVGRRALQQGGSAVDAAISSLLCLGVMNPHSTGIGGGGFMLVYDRKNTKADAIDFRETAPGKAHKDLFKGDAQNGIKGGLSVAVPGELRGMEMAHRKYGKLPWKQLFQPAIQLSRGGFRITDSLDIALQKWTTDVMKDKCFRKMFVRRAYGSTKARIRRKGERVYNRELANTLEKIANAGDASPFYTGKMAETFAKEVRAKGGVIEATDLLNYKAKSLEPLKSKLGSMTMLNVPPPSSGPVLAFIMNILKGYHLKESDWRKRPALVLHRTIEAFKFAYAHRAELGDPAFEPSVQNELRMMMNESYAKDVRRKIRDNGTWPDMKAYGAKFDLPVTTGTTHLVVMAGNGDAVSVMSTVNGYLGAKFRSCALGLIYNNEMDDFSSPGMSNEFGLPPAPPNFIAPGKRPQSSSVPVIILDSTGNVRLVSGASGGSIITTAVAQVIMNHLWLNMSIRDSIQSARVHAQLVPDKVYIETRMRGELVARLKELGHPVEVTDGSHAVVQAIVRVNDICENVKKLRRVPWVSYCKRSWRNQSRGGAAETMAGFFAESDYRKGGLPSGF